jgi:hypothetical protein
LLGGELSLYGTIYSLYTRKYLGKEFRPSQREASFILSCQDEKTGYFLGPELLNWQPSAGASHDLEHIALHLTCTVLPYLQDVGCRPKYPLSFARKFLDIKILNSWLDGRDFSDAWLEGNNLLFVGQVLLYLYEVVRDLEAKPALDYYFAWLDKQLDPKTGLWGTDGFCNNHVAMCGGYHQLLLYYYLDKSVKSSKQLVDVVLGLQHPDGGFRPMGGGGACEDVDAVDILVNAYKREGYRRRDILMALMMCGEAVLRLQGEDGGFPYNCKGRFSHMGIPSTCCHPGISTSFSTWFRVHTLALIQQVVGPGVFIEGGPLEFSDSISMGWHKDSWNAYVVSVQEREGKFCEKIFWWVRVHLYFSSVILKSLVGKILNICKV